MDTEGLEIIYLELKYCERCGGLWLRAQGDGEIYCPPCALKMTDLPMPPRRDRSPGLPLVYDDPIDSEGEDEVWLAVYRDWGNA